MKKLRMFCLILCAFLALTFITPKSYAAEGDAAVSNGCNTLDAAIPYLGTSQLVQNAQAVFLYEQTSDTLMYAWNPDMPVFPSSLIKLVTAFMAVQYGNIQDVVTVSEEALSGVPYDAVSADLQVGEQITLEDLIYCMLVGSANDAASVIATHISGSESAFVEKMNVFVRELGCTATVIKNPHGLHDQEQVSTVRDLARILCAATGNELFRKYFSAVTYTVPATNMSEERYLSSSNFLMNNEKVKIYHDARVTGGRTGIADDGTRCLATTAKSDDLEMVCVVMGSESAFAEDGNTTVYGGFKETTALYDMVFGQYKVVKVIYEGHAIRQSAVLNGDCDVVLGAQSAVTAVLPADVNQESLSFRYSDLQQLPEAPIEVGEKLSELQVWYGDMCVAEAELSAMNTVRTAMQNSDPAVDTHKGTSFWSVMVWIIGGIVILAVAVLLLFRVFAVIKKARQRGQTRRYRRDRRRSR